MKEKIITINQTDYEIAKKEIFEETINDESLKGVTKVILPMLILIIADKLKKSYLRRKTMNEIEKITREIINLENERENVIKNQHFYKAATDICNLYKAYIKVGFTEKQAWELVTIIIKNSLKGDK